MSGEAHKYAPENDWKPYHSATVQHKASFTHSRHSLSLYAGKRNQFSLSNNWILKRGPYIYSEIPHPSFYKLSCLCKLQHDKGCDYHPTTTICVQSTYGASVFSHVCADLIFCHVVCWLQPLGHEKQK